MGHPPARGGSNLRKIWGFREANSANTGLDMGQNLGIAFTARCFTIIKYYNTGGALAEWDLKQEDVALCINSGAYHATDAGRAA